MKKTTKNTSTKAKKPVVGFQTINDLRNATLIISLLINLFVLCLWLTVLATSKYDAALAHLLFNR